LQFNLYYIENMSLDHLEFIEKQKQKENTISPRPLPAWKILIISFTLTIGYVFACVTIAAIFNLNTINTIIAGALLVICAITIYWSYRYLNSCNKKENERRIIREVLEDSKEARLITNSANQTIYFNQKFKTLFTHCSTLPTLDDLTQIFRDKNNESLLFSRLKEQARRGLRDTMELSATIDDKETWFSITAQPVAGWAGYIHWQIEDITRQRDLDKSIHAEREKLIDFTDNAPVGFFNVDENGRFLFVNATLARWLGEDISSLLSSGYLHSYLENPPAHGVAYDITEESGTRQIKELKMKGPAGKSFLASINQTVVHEEHGRIRTRGVVHDLTSEREMRQALQASEDRFQRFFDEAPVGIILLGPNGTIRDCNNAFANLLQLSIKNIENKPFKDFIHKDHSSNVLNTIMSIKQGQTIHAPQEITLNANDSKALNVQMHARRFKSGDNIVLHFIDLTDQKQLEVQFAQSQKMQAVGQLAGGVAHDFNNLLTAIIGFCDLLMLRHKAGDPSFGDIMQIKQNSNRAANLVRQLLAFSRQQTLRPSVHDIGDILTELSHLIRRLIGTNIELDVIHGPDIGLVKVDVGQIEQVLINLAVNARDAILEQEQTNGGRLTIETSSYKNTSPLKCIEDSMPAGEWLSISVTDTGCGISDENLSRIIEPFFTTKEVGQGTGLGLATVYGIIRQTGGYLAIDSTVGQGTCFTIYLPKAAEDTIENPAPDEEKPAIEKAQDLTGTARLLLVEDEDAVRTFSTRALTNKGYEVLAAEHGSAALSLMNEQSNPHIDLMITDVMMPDMDGPTLAKHMRETNPDLKIIFISGYSEDKLKDHMGDNIYFLPKPFTLKQLAAKVKESLDD